MRIVAAVMAALILLFAAGVRLTTADDKHDGEIAKAKVIRLEDDVSRLQKDLDLQKDRTQDVLEQMKYLIEYFNEHGEVPDSFQGFSSGLISIPGQRDNDDDDDDDETRIIERNNSTTIPDSDDDDDNDGGNENDSPSIVEIPSIPGAPQIPKLPDVEDTTNDLLDNTPLGGLL